MAIEIINFESIDGNNNPVTGTCGLHITENVNGKPHLHLFMLPDVPDSRRGDDLFDFNLANVCTNILAERFPGRRIQDAQWQYTKGPFTSKIDFEEQHGLVNRVYFSNGMIQRHGFAIPLEAYEAALIAPEGFKKAICGKSASNIFEGSPETVLLVPVPLHPARFIMMHPNNYSNTHAIVLADAEKFMSSWFQQMLRKSQGTNLDDLRRKHTAPFRY